MSVSITKTSIIRWLVVLCLISSVSLRAFGDAPSIDVKQITFGPKNHLFGYIGQVQNIPWNPQQGTMFYWNPDSPETQFFFNDSDVETHKVFTVLYDISRGKAVTCFF